MLFASYSKKISDFIKSEKDIIVRPLDAIGKKKCERDGKIKMIDHDGTRTHNLPLRRRAPYPLGHAVTLVYKTYYSIINHLSSN
jgi:hypothetical protein